MDADAGLVLVVEDEAAPREMLRASLGARRFRVLTADTGRRALELLDEAEPDTVIVDLGLPDMDGLSLCHHIRARVASPIIVVTADGSEERMVQALDEGADDYIKKPFSMPELLARVRVAVRRHTVMSALVRDEVIELGSLSIDTAGFVVRVAGRVVPVTTKQFQLLVVLARHPGRIVTYRSLTRQIWEPGQESARANALRLLVSGLRQSLGNHPGLPTIVVETGVGYRLVVDDTRE